MKRIFACVSLVFVLLVLVSSIGFTGQLDDYYLQQYGEPSTSALQKAVLLQSQEVLDVAHCGTPLKHGLQRDWSQLVPATQITLAKQVTAPVLANEATLTSLSGRFKIHYASTGTDAPPLVDANANGVPDWVETVAQTFDDVAAFYAAQGWTLAPTVAGAPYDVYMRDLALQSLYGQTTSGQSLASSGFPNAVGSYIEIDNDYLDPVFQNALGGPLTTSQKALQSLQITAAHEYHHSIQYGYNFFFDIWYAEATSTWQEDELYDGVNQLYSYIPAWFNNSKLALDTTASTSTGGGYGRWIFNRYLAEQHGTGVVKAAWDKLATLNSPGANADIPMTPVLDSLLQTATFNSALGTDFLGFAKRVYLRDWTTHLSEISLIHAYVPVGSYSSFPVTSTSSPLPFVNLPHYAFAYYKFTPTVSVPNLTISINKTTAIQTAAYRKSGGSISTLTAASDGSYTVNGFGSLNSLTDEVVLLVVNPTNIDNHQATFSTNGSPAAVTEPGQVVAATGGGGGGGCFIATAAYGSYLHPQVHILRDFRDNYLLTNAPGRAFVALYYRLSPPIADVIARHDMLRLLVRVLLTPVVVMVAHMWTVGLLLAGLVVAWAMKKRNTSDSPMVN